MASSLKPDILVNPADLQVQTSNVSGTVPFTTQVPELGVRSVTGDGREFRYVQAGASALIIGQVQQGAVIPSTLQGVTAVAAAVGATSITLAISSSTFTAGQLSGYFFQTYGSVANGGGQNLQISTNSAVTSGTSITITLADPVQVAITTSASVNVIPQPFAGVIQLPTTQTSAIAGVSVNNLAAGYYGWLQTKGIANVLIQGTPAAFLGLAPSTSTAGALAVVAATTIDIAWNLATGVNGQYGPVRLEID